MSEGCRHVKEELMCAFDNAVCAAWKQIKTCKPRWFGIERADLICRNKGNAFALNNPLPNFMKSAQAQLSRASLNISFCLVLQLHLSLVPKFIIFYCHASCDVLNRKTND